MPQYSYGKAIKFYNALLDAFGIKYPELLEKKIGMVKVLHAFEDKIPLIRVLLDRDLLLGLVLKKSSSEMQGQTAQVIADMLREKDILLARSATTYAAALPALSRVSMGRPFILGDHGGYYAHGIPRIAQHFGTHFIGVTEHTLNGEERHPRYLHPYMSTARIDLKERSDREIAQAIAQETCKMVLEASGLDILQPNISATVLMVGYGTMGMHAARHLKTLGCNAELMVTDISAKKTAFAVQDGYPVAVDLESVLPRCDVIILATDTIIGKKPVLESHHFAMLKENACITSMTSMDDEVRQSERRADGTIKLIGNEGAAGVYKGPNGGHIKFLLDGRPANVALRDGGAGDSIYMVEAAGIAGAFALAHSGALTKLPDEDGEIIAALWLEHFRDVTVPSLRH